MTSLDLQNADKVTLIAKWKLTYSTQYWHHQNERGFVLFSSVWVSKRLYEGICVFVQNCEWVYLINFTVFIYISHCVVESYCVSLCVRGYARAYESFLMTHDTHAYANMGHGVLRSERANKIREEMMKTKSHFILREDFPCTWTRIFSSAHIYIGVIFSPSRRNAKFSLFV